MKRIRYTASIKRDECGQEVAAMWPHQYETMLEEIDQLRKRADQADRIETLLIRMVTSVVQRDYAHVAKDVVDAWKELGDKLPDGAGTMPESWAAGA